MAHRIAGYSRFAHHCIQTIFMIILQGLALHAQAARDSTWQYQHAINGITDLGGQTTYTYDVKSVGMTKFLCAFVWPLLLVMTLGSTPVQAQSTSEAPVSQICMWGETTPLATCVSAMGAGSTPFNFSTVGTVTYFDCYSARAGCTYSTNPGWDPIYGKGCWSLAQLGYSAWCTPVCRSGSGETLNATTGQCDCPQGQRYFDDVKKCVGVTQVSNIAGDPKDNGCTKDCQAVGNPIHPGSGNKFQHESDYASNSLISNLVVARTYNGNPFSTDANVVRSFGKRWTQTYDSKLMVLLNYPTVSCYRRNDNQQIFCVTALNADTPQAVSIVRPDGKNYFFRFSSGEWLNDADVNDRVTAVYASDGVTVHQWKYVVAQGDVTETYDSNGRLVAITSRSGLTQRLTYSNGATNDTSAGRVPSDAPVCTHVQPGVVLAADLLLCVADEWGRQLNFEYDTNGRIVTMIDPAGQQTTYAYDGPSGGCATVDPDNLACSTGNLTQVTYPGRSSKTYYYNEDAQINGGTACQNTTAVGAGFGHLLNSLTGITDENGVRYATWTYDCQGRTTSSQHAGGTDKVTLSYGSYDSNGNGTTTVTHQVGTATSPATTSRNYSYRMLLGQARNTAVSQACIECGDAKTRSYDANGNLYTRTDWNGNKTCFAYDTTRNLETVRLEGTPEATTCGASLAATTLAAPQRKTSTEWHATYRLPLQIAAPNQLTTYAYDSHGNLLTRTEQATTDATGILAFNAVTTGATGTAQTWRTTYNAVGQVLTRRGPRTDLDDTTTYTYDEQGNLASATNAAGQTTRFADYDANGRAGKIVDPNGLVTSLTYTARGWLASHTLDGDTTRYDYDGVGQLTNVTLPDGSSLTYTYDDAHRLTVISDQLGNRLAYTLDLVGNRIGQQASDPNGTLARQLSRVYDSLNRLQQLTGGGQ